MFSSFNLWLSGLEKNRSSITFVTSPSPLFEANLIFPSVGTGVTSCLNKSEKDEKKRGKEPDFPKQKVRKIEKN